MATTDDDDYQNTSATRLGRRRRGAQSTAIDYAAAAGRRPSFDAAGNVRGFRSRAGAPQADPSSTLSAGRTGALGVGSFGGRSDTGAWDQFFKSGRTPLSLAPEAPVNAAAMATGFGGPNTLGSVTTAPPVAPMAAPGAAADMKPQTGNYQPFSPFTAQQSPAATSGMSLTSKYGTGSVLSGADWMTKMKRLAGGSLDWGSTL